MDRARLSKDIEVLFEQFASTKLPPVLNNFKHARKVLYRMYKNRIDIFEVQNDLVTINFNRIKNRTIYFIKGLSQLNILLLKMI